MNDNKIVLYTRQRLIKEKALGKIAGISAYGCVIKFVLKHDIDKTGYLAHGGAIRRFASDNKAWHVVDQINDAAESKILNKPLEIGALSENK